MPFSFTGTLCDHFVCSLILLSPFENKETDFPSTSITVQKGTSLDWRFNDYFKITFFLSQNYFKMSDMQFVYHKNTICIIA